MLAKSKLKIKKVVSQALTHLETTHEEYKLMINEEEKCRRLKESIRMMKNSNEKMNYKKAIKVLLKIMEMHKLER